MVGSETDRAWAAGLFEGEGCISWSGDAKKSTRLVLQMTDEDVVRRFHRFVRCGKVHESNPPSNKHQTSWRWSAGKHEDVVKVLHAFMPMMGERRWARAYEALDAWEKRVLKPKQELGQYSKWPGYHFPGKSE
jgi:hypothetical protein